MVDVYNGYRIVATVVDLASRAHADAAFDFLRLGFNCDFSLTGTVSDGMVKAGVDALDQSKLDGEDRPNGVVPDAELVTQVYDAMRQAEVSERLSGGSFPAI
jgi:hypothetical protein